MSETHLEIERDFSATPGWCLLGLLTASVGTGLLLTTVWWAGLPLIWFGVPVLIHHASLWIRRPPRIVAWREGVWFGGGAAVPWAEIRAIRTGAFQVPKYPGVRFAAGSNVLAIDFHDKSVLRRLPMSMRWRGTRGIGDLDLAYSDFRADPTEVVEQLGTIRSRAARELESVPNIVVDASLSA